MAADPMTAQPQPARFGAEFVARVAAVNADKPFHRRDLLYDIAVKEEFASWRSWMDEQLAYLNSRAADVMANKLWRERDHWSGIFELATGAALRDIGYNVAYEESWKHGNHVLTPDWTVRSADGSLVCLVEVHTDQPPNGVDSQIRGWQEFADRFATIASPYLFMVDAGSPRRPPTSGVGKRIIEEMRLGHFGIALTGRFSSHGYNFRVATDDTGQPLRAPTGLRARLATPTPIAGQVSTRKLTQKVNQKVVKYRRLAEWLAVPLIIAIGAEPFTGISLDCLDDVLAGSQTITLQFNASDLLMGVESTSVTPGRLDRWSMPEELAGLLWLSNQFPFKATARPNDNTRRPMPAALQP